MNAIQPLLNDHQVAPAAGLSGAAATNSTVQESRKVQAARDFESLLVGKLVDSMKGTVGESGLLEDEGSEQMQSMFWMHMTTAMSQQGGIGLWKDIYTSIYGTAPAQKPDAGTSAQQIDRTI